MSFEEKTAIVTGAAEGIGRKIALELAQAGVKVAIMDVDPDKARQTSQEIAQLGGTAIAIKVDVRDNDEVTAGVQQVIAELGQVDILVNNAGIFRISKELKDMQDHEWENMFDINVYGIFRCCRAVLPHMEQRQSGRIINIASVAGVGGIARMSVYSSSKGAIIAFSKALAMEEGKHNITVNCISPGVLKSYGDDDSRGTFLKCSGELGTETAHLVKFLASNDAGFITGANYVVDGGRLLGARRA